MKKIVVLIALTALFSAAAAQETLGSNGTEEVKYSNAIYVHPLSLIVGSASSVLPLMLNFTIEHALAPKAALIFTPNYFSWTLESGLDDELNIQSFGAGVGYRKYLSKPSSGVYLQAKVDAGYMSAEVDYVSNVTYGKKTAEFSGAGVSILGYVGTKGQWDHICMFIDGGLGFGYIGVETDVPDANLDFNYGATGLDWDINFGLGYAF